MFDYRQYKIIRRVATLATIVFFGLVASATGQRQQIKNRGFIEDPAAQPVADARVFFEVEAYVLPGKVWLRVPYDFGKQIPTQRTVQQEFTVEGSEPFEAGEIEVPTKN